MTCDYYHVTDEADIDDTAERGYIGEAGVYYLCDHHFQMRPEDAKRNWHRLSTQEGPAQ